MGFRMFSWLASFGLAFLLSAESAPASVIAESGDGSQLGHAQRIKGTGRFDGVTARIDGAYCVPFDPADFLIAYAAGDISTVVPITTSTTPGLALSDKGVFIEWADGEETPIQKKFKVPSDYSAGGVFKVLLGRSGTALTPAIDFEVFVDKDVTAFDVAATNQTAVALSSDVAAGSPDEVTLTVTTDFDSLAADDWVTLNLWRDDTNTSTDNLEFYAGEFCYHSTE